MKPIKGKAKMLREVFTISSPSPSLELGGDSGRLRGGSSSPDSVSEGLYSWASKAVL